MLQNAIPNKIPPTGLLTENTSVRMMLKNKGSDLSNGVNKLKRKS